MRGFENYFRKKESHRVRTHCKVRRQTLPRRWLTAVHGNEGDDYLNYCYQTREDIRLGRRQSLP